jgi:hypothetical protein
MDHHIWENREVKFSTNQMPNDEIGGKKTQLNERIENKIK